eukprot:5010295-Pyramimonas_sp.AAC.1
MATQYPVHAHAVLAKSKWTWDQWPQHLQDLERVSLPVLGGTVEVSSRAERRARGRAIHASLEQFRDWIVTEPAVNILHNILKKLPPPAEGVCIAGGILHHPRDTVDHKVTRWHNLWHDDTLDPVELFHTFDRIRDEAQFRELPPLTGAQ